MVLPNDTACLAQKERSPRLYQDLQPRFESTSVCPAQAVVELQVGFQSVSWSAPIQLDSAATMFSGWRGSSRTISATLYRLRHYNTSDLLTSLPSLARDLGRLHCPLPPSLPNLLDIRQRLMPEVRVVQSRIMPALGHELFVAPLLDDAPFIQHDDAAHRARWRGGAR